MQKLLNLSATDDPFIIQYYHWDLQTDWGKIQFLPTFALFSSPPVAAFFAAPTEGIAPLTVTFTDASVPSPTSWEWIFSNVTGNATDTVFSTDQSPGYIFGVGNWSIKLRATNSAGMNTSTVTTFVNVSAVPVVPVAGIPWILDYGINSVVDRRFQYGLGTDIPITGDFNNDGLTDIGVFRMG